MAWSAGVLGDMNRCASHISVRIDVRNSSMLVTVSWTAVKFIHGILSLHIHVGTFNLAKKMVIARTSHKSVT